MAHAACVGRATKQARSQFERRRRVGGTRDHAESRHPVERAATREHPQVAGLRDGRSDGEAHAVGRLRHLRELAVALLTRPGSRCGRARRPLLAVGPPAVHPHHHAAPLVVDQNVWRRDVRVEVGAGLGRVWLGAKERGVLHVQHTGVVDRPWPGHGIGVRQPDEFAEVVGEVHVVLPHRMLDPRRHAYHRGAVHIPAEGWRRGDGDERIAGDAARVQRRRRLAVHDAGTQNEGRGEPRTASP